MPLIFQSGGLVYHARALRYRNGLWQPFRRSLADWLARVLPAGDELILVGPSAGHCLPLEQLRRFRRLTLLEPDPVARFWLQRRLEHPNVEVEHRDLLVGPLVTGGVGLEALLQQREHAAVLFCNLLGQVQLELSSDEQIAFVREFQRRVLPQLARRRWASFHDRWSLDRGLDEPEPPREIELDHVPSDDELGVACFGPEGAPLIVLDHATAELFPEPGPRRYFAWQITPRALHIVEAVSG
jgi:hypothetical protein